MENERGEYIDRDKIKIKKGKREKNVDKETKKFEEEEVLRKGKEEEKAYKERQIKVCRKRKIIRRNTEII